MEQVELYAIILALLRARKTHAEIAEFLHYKDPKAIRKIIDQAQKAKMITPEERKLLANKRRSIAQKGKPRRKPQPNPNIGEEAIAKLYDGRRYNLGGGR